MYEKKIFRSNLKKVDYKEFNLSNKNQKFISKYNLPFDLGSDEEQKVVKAYDVWGLKKFMGKEYMGITRRTFILNEDSVIEEIITKVNTKEHTGQILK